MLEIREITENEIAYIEALEKNTFSDAWSENALAETWRQPHSILLGAWMGHAFAGYIIVYCMADECEIARIAVDVSNRCQGVGRALLQEMQKRCMDAGCVRMLLDVRESNETAIRFYKGHGFCTDGVRKDYYEKPRESAVLMSRMLGK